MAFKEVQVTDINYIRPSRLAESGATGVILEGEYVGPVANPMSGKNDYKFETSAGTTIINNSGTLQKRMEKVNPGTLCQVIYNGKTAITSGPLQGKEAHQFNVLVEDGN